MDRAALDFRSFFEDTAALVPERPYLIWTEDDSETSYQDFDAAMNRAANTWRALGVRRGGACQTR